MAFLSCSQGVFLWPFIIKEVQVQCMQYQEILIPRGFFELFLERVLNLLRNGSKASESEFANAQHLKLKGQMMLINGGANIG